MLIPFVITLFILAAAIGVIVHLSYLNNQLEDRILDAEDFAESALDEYNKELEAGIIERLGLEIQLDRAYKVIEMLVGEVPRDITDAGFEFVDNSVAIPEHEFGGLYLAYSRVDPEGDFNARM